MATELRMAAIEVKMKSRMRAGCQRSREPRLAIGPIEADEIPAEHVDVKVRLALEHGEEELAELQSRRASIRRAQRRPAVHVPGEDAHEALRALHALDESLVILGGIDEKRHPVGEGATPAIPPFRDDPSPH